MKKLVFFEIIISITINSNIIKAQNICINNSVLGNTTIPGVYYNCSDQDASNSNTNFQLSNSSSSVSCIASSSVNWFIKELNPISGIPMNTGSNVSIDANGLVNYTTQGSSNSLPYLFEVTMTGNGFTPKIKRIYVYYTLPINLSLVIDISGSMGLLAGLDPNLTRLKLLTISGAKFLDFYNEFAIQNPLDNSCYNFTDRININYFTDQVSSFPSDGSLLSFSGNNINSLKSNLSSKNPQKSTGMGLGILNAIYQLSTVSSPITVKQNIILFTDGMQNYPLPMVYGTTGGVYFDSQGDPTAIPAWASSLTIPSNLGGIRISTIGLAQSNGDFLPNLRRIATATGGYFNLAPFTQVSDLDNNFLFALTQVLRGSSPQVTEILYNTLPQGSTKVFLVNKTETFLINKNVSKAIFDLTVYGSDNFSFNMVKDGQDLVQYGKVISGTGYRSVVYDFPLYIAGDTIWPEGIWTMKIAGQAGSLYKALAIVNDHALKYAPSIGGTGRTGSPIELKVPLSWHVTPITNATVTAFVLKPGHDLGDLLSTSTVKKTDGNSAPDVSSVGFAKLLEMLKNDPTLYDKLKAQQIAVVLKADSNGVYTSQYTATDVTGSYQVIFQIAGETSELGAFIRTEMQTTAIELADIDLSASTPSVTIQNGIGIVSVRPKSKNGLFLGPDYGNRLILSVDGKRISNFTDAGDGTYTYTITGATGNENVTLSVLEESVFTGKLKDFNAKPWYLVYWWGWILLLLLIALIIWIIRKI